MRAFLFAWAPAAVWAGVLFLVSATSHVAVPSAFPWSDKVAHLGAYAVLGLLLAWGRRRSPRPPPHALLVALGTLYGVTDEWHQSFVPGRDPSVWDWAADTLGVLAGYLFLLALVPRRDPRPPAPPDPGESHTR